MNKIEINIDYKDNKLLSLDEDKVRNVANKILDNLSLDNKGLSLYFCDNERIRELNKQFRNKDKATDVLSFESGETAFLGDIAISVEKAEEQKEEFESPTIDAEIIRLLIHGILHLIGYDHEINEEEAVKMNNKENELFMEVGKLILY